MVNITGAQPPASLDAVKLPAADNKGEEAKPQANPEDSVNISGGKLTVGKVLKGIAMFPFKVVETASGIAVGTLSTAIHALPGTFEGLSEAIHKDNQYVDTGAYSLALVGEFLAGGATAGFIMGGPVGAGIGAVSGLFSGLILRHMEGKAKFHKEFCRSVEEAVDTATQDNQSPSKVQNLTQDITEGAIVGTVVGMGKGWSAGYEAGKGVFSGIRDVAEGVIEGIQEAIKFKDEE